jgi:hypothetical protein
LSVEFTISFKIFIVQYTSLTHYYWDCGLCRSKVGTLSCHDEELLLLKATSQATVLCMESALAMLQVRIFVAAPNTVTG